MANKYYRQNLRNGTPRKSNIAKIMETFGTKKKVKKPKKRMFANKGGGADTGRIGEIKSKLAVARMKAQDAMGKKTGGLTKEQIEKLKKIMKKRIGEKEMIPFKKPKLNRGIFNPERFEEMEKEKRKKFIEKFKKAGSPEFSKGGRAALKKGSKFPDHSGDGKITQKDILMAKGVIPKKKNNKKVI